MRVGVEMEFWVIDRDGALCDGHDLASVHERVEPEFVESLIELQTAPHDDIAGVERDLAGTLRPLIEEARRTERSLVPLGTPLTACTSPVTSERGAALERIYGEGLAVAKNCAGTHVHFDQGDVARQLNVLTALDPALALVSSSPYYEGERLANSSRAYAYRNKAGPNFAKYRDLWSYADDTAEWERRLNDIYEEFRSAARNRGVSDEEFADLFDPEDVVVTPVRLRRQTPTVEWRSPDTALPTQTVRLLDDVARLLRRTEELPVEVGDPGLREGRLYVPAYADLEHHSDDAIERGLHSTAVRAYLESMSIDTTRYRPISGQIYGSQTISEDRARRIRLAFADALDDDVRLLAD